MSLLSLSLWGREGPLYARSSATVLPLTDSPCSANWTIGSSNTTRNAALLYLSLSHDPVKLTVGVSAGLTARTVKALPRPGKSVRRLGAA